MLCMLAFSRASLRADEKEVTIHKYTNALIHSTSPYLLQHAHNPVNWMPWGPEAFAKAKKENKPVFVSIGYSTCYWCHVMERQSFENEEVAEILNDKYIAIKVDREERPDIDEQLMLATQLMTGRGGWPNSVWLTTDGRPWMAGTYFPKAQFVSALEQLATAWEEQKENVEKQANSLSDAIRQAAEGAADIPVLGSSGKPFEAAIGQIEALFDAEFAGFGNSPKFPPHGMLRLLAVASQSTSGLSSERQEKSELMLSRTLEAMWCGGVHDHVGGGFHRYSTDQEWLLPHFEKMLYDNAQLVRSYAEAYEHLHASELKESELFRAAVADIYNWLEREMTDPLGGFYSAIDSESEGGEEGKYYTWTLKELRKTLGDDDAGYFASTFHFEEGGNFLEEATKEKNGTNIPHLVPTQIGTLDNIRIASLSEKLNKARESREYPHLDDKVITAWNGLMISALAHAGRILEEPRYIKAADRAALFLLSTVKQPDGTLLRTWRKGKVGDRGYLNDYAFLCEGFLELYEATNDAEWLSEAMATADLMLKKFEDPNGGFFFTSREHEELLLRSKNLTGGGNLPVGNGVALQVLIRLHELSGEQRFLQSAARGLNSFQGLMLRSPQQVEHLILANIMFESLQAKAREPKLKSVADFQSAAVKGRVLIQDTKLKPGDVLEVRVAFDIDDNYHIYAASQESDALVATSIVLRQPKAWTIRELKTPKASPLMQDGAEETVLTYEGSVMVSLSIEVPAIENAGEKELELEINYQACEKSFCLTPSTHRIQIPIKVADSDEKSGT